MHRRPDVFVNERRYVDAEALVDLGELPRKTLADYVHLRARPIQRHAGPEPREDEVIALGLFALLLATRSFLVDISPYFDRKLKAINCFASQFSGDMRDVTELYPAWGRLIDRITTQCKYFGHLMGVDYAEPFVVKESLAIDDIVAMPVPSV